MGVGDRAERSGDAGRIVLVVLVLAVLTGSVAVLTGSTSAASTAGSVDATPTAGSERVTDAIRSERGHDVDGADARNDSRRTDTPPTTCFDGGGYPLSIGNGSATIDAVVHVSVLTDPAAGDEFGVELAGSTDRHRIVTLAAGVRFTAPGPDATVLNPFAAFDLLYTYELRLPMFEGALDETEHREDRSPVGSPAGSAPC